MSVRKMTPKWVKDEIKQLSEKIPVILFEKPKVVQNDLGNVEVDIFTADEMRKKTGNKDAKFEDETIVLKTDGVEIFCFDAEYYRLGLMNTYRAGTENPKKGQGKIYAGLEACQNYVDEMLKHHKESLEKYPHLYEQK